MLKNGALVAVLLSVFVLGMSIFVGSLLIQQFKSEPQIASVGIPQMDSDGGDLAVSAHSDEDPKSLPSEGDSDVIVLDLTVDKVSDVATVDKSESASVVPEKEPESKIVAPSKVVSTQSGAKTAREYWVQAGSFSTLTRAMAASQALQDLGLSGSIETVEHQGRILYRLRFGAWQSLEEAQRFRDYLRDQITLRKAFLERGIFDRSSDFVDAYVVERGGK